MYLLIGALYTIEANQNPSQKYDHSRTYLVKGLGSYTSLAIYGHRINTYTKFNTTNWFQIMQMLSNNNKQLSNFEKNQRPFVTDFNSNKTIFEDNNQQRNSFDRLIDNNYVKAIIFETSYLEAKKSKERNKKDLELQRPNFKTKKNQNLSYSKEDYMVDFLDPSSPNFNLRPNKLQPRVKRSKNLNRNQLHVSSAPLQSKDQQSDSSYSKNGSLTSTTNIDFLNKENHQNLSLYINEDRLEKNKLDKILSVSQIEAAKIRPHVEAAELLPQVKYFNMDSWNLSVSSGQRDQAVKWTPIELAVKGKTHSQAAKSGLSDYTVNWDRQDQRQTSGKSQC